MDLLEELDDLDLEHQLQPERQPQMHRIRIDPFNSITNPNIFKRRYHFSYHTIRVNSLVNLSCSPYHKDCVSREKKPTCSFWAVNQSNFGRFFAISVTLFNSLSIWNHILSLYNAKNITKMNGVHFTNPSPPQKKK